MVSNFNDIKIETALGKSAALGELSELLPEWQHTLRLRDWLISLKVCRYYEMPPNRMGNFNAMLERRMAHIQICLPGDMPTPESAFRCDADPENTLIHELLHCHFEPFWDEDKKVVMEQAISAIAGAFLEMKQRIRGLEAQIAAPPETP